jgi:hypothetical protein
MKKDKRSFARLRTMAGTRDGELSILINLSRKELRDMIKNTDSTSIEHSSSDQDFQCGELLKMCLIILDSEDIPIQEEDNKPSNSIK